MLKHCKLSFLYLLNVCRIISSAVFHRQWTRCLFRMVVHVQPKSYIARLLNTFVMGAMPSKFSVSAVAESEPSKWELGEDLAAAAIISVTFYLILEV